MGTVPWYDLPFHGRAKGWYGFTRAASFDFCSLLCTCFFITAVLWMFDFQSRFSSLVLGHNHGRLRLFIFIKIVFKAKGPRIYTVNCIFNSISKEVVDLTLKFQCLSCHVEIYWAKTNLQTNQLSSIWQRAKRYYGFGCHQTVSLVSTLIHCWIGESCCLDDSRPGIRSWKQCQSVRVQKWELRVWVRAVRLP